MHCGRDSSDAGPRVRTYLVSLATWAVLACGSRSGLPVFDVGANAGAAPSSTEACNGLDEDDDGLIDEGIAELSCGTGDCLRRVPGCVRGQIPECVPGTADDERCGGADEDCDGRIDEGLGFGPTSAPLAISDPAVSGPPDPSLVQAPFNRDLVATPAGLLAFFTVAFRGTAPAPNLFAVVLDAEGMPTGAESPLLERPVTQGPRAAPSADAGVLLAYCGRFAGGNDIAVLARVDAAGRLLAELSAEGATDPACGASAPHAQWTGQRQLGAWTDNSGSGRLEPVGKRTQLMIADPDLERLQAHDLSEPGFEGDLSAAPRMAPSGTGIALAWGVRPQEDLPRSELRLATLDADGAVRGPAAALGPPPVWPGDDRADWGALSLVPVGDGLMLLAANARGEGLLAMHLDAAARPVGRARYIQGIDGRVDAFRAARAPTGGAYLAIARTSAIELLRLDSAARILDRFEVAPGRPGGARPALAVRGGRVFVTWTRREGDGGRVFVQRFGCVP